MLLAPTSSSFSASPIRRLARRVAFTLMELMVAIGILVIIILSVGVIFSGASRSVSVSQATMDLMASVRATQQLMERDLAGLDKNGFLVIRSRILNINTAAAADASLHFDQLSFLTYGSFPNRTGADTTSPFTDSTTANAAHVWWGHLVIEKATGGDNSYFAPNQKTATPIAQLPTGVPTGSSPVEKEFVLGRHASLLLPGNGTSALSPAGNKVMAYPTLDASPAGVLITGSDGVQTHITSSRYSVVAQTPAQVMQQAAAYNGTNPPYPAEAYLFTNRFRALASIYDTDLNSFSNGYFRMTPIVLQAVSSFKVEWTDGATWPNDATNPFTGQSIAGELKWYGPTTPYGSTNYGGNTNLTPDPTTGDNAYYLFNYNNRATWPKALRITMHIANDRLPGGRDFAQVIQLPE